MSRIAAILLLTCFATSLRAQAFDHSALILLDALHRQPTALAQYAYLDSQIPKLPKNDQLFAAQFRSFALAELGLYNQAVLSFPLDSDPPASLVLPQPSRFRAADALDTITRLAADRRIVLVNEAHHNAHTRLLILQLLPKLRALGFNYFAAEALGDSDPQLAKRGYPIGKSGSQYLKEPVYGEIVREALRLGFVVVPYDSTSIDPQLRDAEQARNLYDRVLRDHPQARLFVQAGYAHVDKARGRLGSAAPMAMTLAKLSGVQPLSIDQTEFLETGGKTDGDYRELIARFPTETAQVLIDRDSGKPWSDQPQLYDLNVILPPALGVNTYGDAFHSGFGDAKVHDVQDATRLVTG
jgi:hypothetical protein